jgi:hypothetical protein
VSDGHGGRIEVSCLVAREDGAPEGVKPVEWRLLTNRPIDTFEAATELIDWYRARWEIELFFHVLKNGCRVEALQLSTVEREDLGAVHGGGLADCPAHAPGAHLPRSGCGFAVRAG